MTRPPITSETQALLDELHPPAGSDTTVHTDRLYQLAGPVHDVLDHVMERVRTAERLLRLADAVETADYAYGHFEQIKQKLAAAMREARNAADAVQQLTDTCWQLDGVVVAMGTSLDSHEERQAHARTVRERVVAISVDELAHLRERAAQGEETAAENVRGAPGAPPT